MNKEQKIELCRKSKLSDESFEPLSYRLDELAEINLEQDLNAYKREENAISLEKLREDEPYAEVSGGDVLKNAPHVSGRYIITGKVYGV